MLIENPDCPSAGPGGAQRYDGYINLPGVGETSGTSH